MQSSQELRGRLFGPMLGLLVKLKITANHLTLLSLVTGLAFCPVFLWGSKVAAFLLLVAHVLLDGLDGPLARYTGRASNKGSFTDTMADQIVVTFATVAMIHAGRAGIWPGSLYIFFYSLVVAFAMVRNALAIPYSWLVRPRFLVFAWFVVEVWVWPGTLNYLLWSVTALLGAKVLTGFIQIRRKM